jgi:hypothetical protein
MRAAVGNLSEVKTERSGPAVRFSVSWIRDDGRTAQTTNGFLLMKGWKVRPPVTRGRFNSKPIQFVEIDKDFERELLDCLEQIPDVTDVLGPRPAVEEILPPQEEKERRFGEGKLFNLSVEAEDSQLVDGADRLLGEVWK